MWPLFLDICHIQHVRHWHATQPAGTPCYSFTEKLKGSALSLLALHTFIFFHFVCGVCIRVYLFMDVFSSCMHTGDHRLMLNVLLSLPLPFCFGDRVSDWIWSSSIQLVGKTHRTLLSLSPSAALQACTPGFYMGAMDLNSGPQACAVTPPAPTPLYASQTLLFPFLIPALPSLFLDHTSLFPVPQAHQAPFYLCAFPCKVLLAPHPLPAKLRDFCSDITSLKRSSLRYLQVIFLRRHDHWTYQYSLDFIFTWVITKVLLFSPSSQQPLCRKADCIHPLLSVFPAYGKKESAHQRYCHCLPNDWTADCHALRTVPSSFPYIHLSADERGWGEKKSSFFL